MEFNSGFKGLIFKWNCQQTGCRN